MILVESETLMKRLFSFLLVKFAQIKPHENLNLIQYLEQEIFTRDLSLGTGQ